MVKKYPAFSPDSLFGLRAWYSGDYGITADASRSVSRWANRAGDAGLDLVQSTGSAQPMLTRFDDYGNIVPYSQDQTNASWAIRNTNSVAVTAGQGTPPGFSENVACRLVESSDADEIHGLRVTYSSLLAPLRTGDLYTHEVIAKAAGRGWIGLLGNGTGRRAYFDLINGVVGTVGPATGGHAEIASLGDGWFRCRYTGPVVSGATAFDIVLAQADSSADLGPSYLGDGSAVLIAAASMRLESWPGVYVPTTTFAELPGVAGKNTVSFDGVIHEMATAAASISGDKTIYLVLQPLDSVDAIIFSGLTDATFSAIWSQPDNGILALAGGLQIPSSGSFAASLGKTWLGTIAEGSATSRASSNVVVTGSGNTVGQADMGGISIGASASSLFFRARFAELLIYNVAHEQATQFKVISYLKARWRKEV